MGLFDDLPDATSTGVSPALTNKVKQFEGFSPRAYGDYKQTSVGYGTRGVPGEVIDEQTATMRLNSQLARNAGRIDGAAQHFGLTLAPQQRDALISFDYNTGAGDRVLAQSGGDLSKLPSLMGQFVHVTKPDGTKAVLPGLVDRRNQEISMFLGQPFNAAPSFTQLQPSPDTVALGSMVPKETDISGVLPVQQTAAKAPKVPQMSAGTFDDLPDATPATTPQGGFFDDLPDATATPQAGPKPEVGFLEAASRTGQNALWSVPEFVNRGIGMFPYLEDKAIEAVTGKDPGMYKNWSAMAIDPIAARRKALEIRPDENLTTGGKIGAAVGPLARDLPLIAATGGLAELPAGASVLARLAHGAASMAPTGAIAGMDKQKQVIEQGGSQGEALMKGLGSQAITTATGAVPMAVQSGAPTLAGRLLSRGVQGAAIAAPVGTVARQAEQLMDGQPVTGMNADDLISAVPMGVISAVTGGRAPAPREIAPQPRSSFSDLRAAEEQVAAQQFVRSQQEAEAKARGESVADQAKADSEAGVRQGPEIYEGQQVPDIFADLPTVKREAPATEAKAPERMTPEEFEKAAQSGVIHEATGKFTPEEELLKTPLTIGEYNKYSPSDIATFYSRRDGGWREGAYNLVKDAQLENRPINAELWDEVVTKPPKGYEKSGDLYVPKNESEAPATEPVAKNAAEPAATEPTLTEHVLVKSGRKNGKPTFDVVQNLTDAEGNKTLGERVATGLTESAANKARREADKAAGVGKRAPAKTDDGFFDHPLTEELAGRLMSASAAKRKGKAFWESVKSQYDDIDGMFADKLHQSRMYGGTLTPDKAAKEAAESGLLPPDATARELHAELTRLSAAAKDRGRQLAARIKQETQAEKEAAKAPEAPVEQPKAPEEAALTPEELEFGKAQLARLEASGRGDTVQAQRIRDEIARRSAPTLENRPEGQLLREADMPFSLTGEVDSTPTPAEIAAKEREAAQAEANKKAQGDLFAPKEEPTTAQKIDAWADRTIQESRGRLNMGVDPVQTAAYVWKGARFIQQGITDFAKWSKAMIDEFGDKIRPHLKSLFDQSQNFHQAQMAAEAHAAGGNASVFQTVADKARQTMLSTAGRLGDFAQVAFAQNAARMETLISRVEDKKAQAVLQRLADSMHTSPGRDRAVNTNTYHEDVSTKIVQFKNDLDRAFQPYLEEIKSMSAAEKSDFMSRVGQLLTQEDSKTIGGKFGKVLNDLRDLQAKLLQYQREAGVEIGERDNYLKRVIDEQAVAANQDKFLTQATKVYEAMGMEPDEAAGAAEAYLSRILHSVAGVRGEGENSLKFEAGNGSPKHTKSRELGPEADELLKDFYYRDVHDILATQIHSAVQLAEFSRRFGQNSEKWDNLIRYVAKRGVSPEITQEIRDIIISQTGGYRQYMSRTARSLTDLVSLGNLLGFMARSTYGSLSEPVVTAMRSGKLRDIWGSYTNSLRETVNIIRGKDPSDQALLAEDLGIISSAMADQALTGRFMMEDSPNNSLSRRIGNNFMRRIGLLQWTEGTKIAANVIAQRHINRLAEDYVAGRRMNIVQRELRNLGIANNDMEDFVAYARRLTAKGLDIRSAVMDETSPEAALYRRALVRFNRESIMEPSAADRPRPATHPIYRTAFGLMGYLYSFSRNVNSRIGGMLKDAVNPKAQYTAMERLNLLKPLAFLPIMVAAQYGLGELRNAIWNDPSRRYQPEQSFRSKIWMALSRANILGKWDFPFNTFNLPALVNGVMDWATGTPPDKTEGRRYQKEPATALLGPTIGLASEGLQNTVGLFTDKNSERTNTQERKAVRNYYDIFAKPAAGALMSSGAVPPLLGAVGIQLFNHPFVREAAVAGIAGDPIPPKGLGSTLSSRGGSTRGSGSRGGSSRGASTR